jgi:hypothetical protein
MGMFSDGLAWGIAQLQANAQPGPDQTVNLNSRRGEGDFAAPVPWLAYQEPAKTDDKVLVNAQTKQTWRRFNLWKVDQVVDPQLLDQIDDGSQTWQVKMIDKQSGGGGPGIVFCCMCLLEV